MCILGNRLNIVSITVTSMQPLTKDEVDRIVDNNLVDEFDRLAATPGFVLTRMPFEKVRLLLR